MRGCACLVMDCGLAHVWVCPYWYDVTQNLFLCLCVTYMGYVHVCVHAVCCVLECVYYLCVYGATNVSSSVLPPPCLTILPEFISDEEDAEGDGYDHDKSVADLSTSLVINRDEFNQGKLPGNHQNL